MFQTVRQNLTVARAGQIALVYSVGLAAYLFTTIPHSWWIFVTVLMMTAAIEPGLVIQRSVHRGKGTLAGIIIFIPLIYLLQFNYRLIPLVFIMAACLISVPSAKRYDISVIFTTMMVFILTAYTFNQPLLEGPIEQALNRAVCTILGIVICIGGDYFIFAKFKYPRKAYYVLQHELCNLLQEKLELILAYEKSKMNAYILVENLRDSLNNKFSEICTSGDSLVYDLKTDNHTREQVKIFDKLMWELRREIYAIYFCHCKLGNQRDLAIRVNRFNEMLNQARANLIKI